MEDYYQWHAEYNTGVAKIDTQHKGFFKMLNEIYQALQNGNDKDALTRLLTGIVDYADVHFSTEEELFDKYSYPKAMEHKTSHDKFREQAKDLNKSLVDGLTTVNFELLDFLDDWIVNHITNEDQLYKPFFEEKGVK